MTENQKQAILMGRASVDAYLQSTSHSNEELVQLEADLQGLGFNSLDEFYAVNKRMNVAELRRCYAKSGSCTGCSTQTDVCAYYREVVFCNVTSNEIPASFDWQDFYLWREFPGCTPSGCQIAFSKVIDPDFDIAWGMIMAISPFEYSQAGGE